MTAQPVHDFDPVDPVEIMRVLPARYHGQFLAEYDEVAAGARRPECYHQLHDLLRLWRLRAVAYSDPGFDARLEAARSGAGEGTPVEDVVPGWAGKVAAARRRRAAGELADPVRRAKCSSSSRGHLAAFDAIVELAVALVDEPWDAVVMTPRWRSVHHAGNVRPRLRAAGCSRSGSTTTPS